jgi:hypothetical protein
VTHLERTDTGPVACFGDLVCASGRRHPLTLSHEDWEALETALTVHEAMSDLGAPMPDLHAIEESWLRGCPIHDAGIPAAECACPDGDAREVIRRLVDEVRRAYDTARDGYHTLCKRFVDQPWKTRQEIDAMRPVVEAARAYLAFQRTVVVPGIDSIPHEFIRLAAAVDALDGAS